MAMPDRIKEHFSKLATLPMLTRSTDCDGSYTLLSDAFITTRKMLENSRMNFIIGNGGSASIASHMAEDYTKNGGIRMMAFNDASMLTCFANDMGYENVFSSAISYYANKKDAVIAISSSGQSANILNGVKMAKSMGCPVITFSGFKDSNHLRKLGDVNFYVPDTSYGNVEITHLALLHAILDFICEDNNE